MFGAEIHMQQILLIGIHQACHTLITSHCILRTVHISLKQDESSKIPDVNLAGFAVAWHSCKSTIYIYIHIYVCNVGFQQSLSFDAFIVGRLKVSTLH